MKRELLLTAAILSTITAGVSAEDITLKDNHTVDSNYNLVSTVGNVKVDPIVPKNENTVYNVILGGWSKYTGTNIYNIFSGTEVAPSGRNVENIAIGDVVKIKDSDYGLMIGNHITNENDEESIKKYGRRSTMIKGDYITVKNSPHATVLGQDNTVTNSYGAFVHGKDAVAENATWSVVMGQGASAKMAVPQKGASVVIGQGANTNSNFTVALGVNASAKNYAATAIGGSSEATGKYSLAMAQGTANGYGAVAIGMNSVADKEATVTLGIGSKAMDGRATAIGKNANASKADAISIGSCSGASGVDSTAIGDCAKAQGDSSIAMGTTSKAVTDKSVAIGDNSVANGKDAIAIGSKAKAIGNGSVNVGANNQINQDSLAYGTIVGSNNTINFNAPADYTGDGTVVVGHGNIIEDSKNGIVIGTAATVQGSDNSIAIGSNSKVAAPNSVALGDSAFAYDVESTASGEIAGTTYNFAGGIAAGTVGIGSRGDNSERTITGLAAGRINEESTDAINGSQLHSVITEVNRLDQATKAVVTDAAKHTTVVAGKNTTVTEATNVAGGKEYTVSVNKHLTDMQSAAFHSDGVMPGSGGDTHISGSGIHVNDLDENNSANISPKNIYVRTEGYAQSDLKSDELRIQNYDNGSMLLNTDGLYATDNAGKHAVQFTTKGISAGNQKIENVTAGTADTDAVNVKQLKDSITAATSNMVDHDTITTVVAGSNTTVSNDGNHNYTVAVNKDLTNMNSVNLGNNTDAERARLEAAKAQFFNDNTSTNTAVTANGVAIENTDNLDQANYSINGMTASGPNATVSFTTEGINAGNQIINGVKAGVAGTDAVNVDQMKKYVNNNRTIVQAGENITVTGSDGLYTVSTAKDLTGLNSVNLNDGNNESKYSTKGIDMTYRGDGANGLEYHTSYHYNGLTIKTNDGDANPVNEVSLTDKGLNNGGNRITNVNKGVDGTDAVNVNQLRETETNINDRINNISNAATARANHYTDLQTAKVGARAAAMANLHYQDFNADDKWSFAAGYGHYKGANAGALGVAYQPNENTMVTVSSTIGSDTMIGAGVSMKFGKSSKMNTNKQVAMAKEIEELRAIVAAQNAKIDALVDHAMGRNEAITDVVFPDVPENHWAYMMVQDLAYKGIVVGYPDGNYQGSRTLTRYEFAVALDRAISAGYMSPELGRAIKEFKVELDQVQNGMRFRVDRVSGRDGATDKVERVRVNKDNTRDNYGTIVR